jgi:hypothetical protein
MSQYPHHIYFGSFKWFSMRCIDEFLIVDNSHYIH